MRIGRISVPFPLSEVQLSTLTLILCKHVLANKIAGRNTKEVVLISNSAIE